MIWCLNCGKSYGSRPISEHVCNPRDVALQRLFAPARTTRPTAVHHINGNPYDNRPENLEVVDLAAHTRSAAPETEETP